MPMLKYLSPRHTFQYNIESFNMTLIIVNAVVMQEIYTTDFKPKPRKKVSSFMTVAVS